MRTQATPLTLAEAEMLVVRPVVVDEEALSKAPG